MAVAGNGGAVVGSEEEDEARDFVGRKDALEGLIVEDLRLVLFGEPEAVLE